MPTTVTLSGFKEFEQKCKNIPQILMQELDGEVEDAARLWESLAVQAAPVDQGFLKGLISKQKITLGEWEVTSEAEHSAFLEFGTKTRVSVPAELQVYAMNFKTGYTPGGAKKMIFAWMKRVGIVKEAWWVVFMSIIIKGIYPHPFFFPQKPLAEKQFITGAQRILNTEH